MTNLRGATDDRKVYGVTELTRRIKTALETGFGRLWVEGEISNVRRPASGHLYFTIKDAGAQISAVMFRGDQFGLRFQPADGVLVQAYGQLSVYERSGQYQIVVRQMDQGGQGALQAAFEKLKAKLLAEGLFDEGRKRPLPLLPQHVGIVTSPTGAAIRDILNVVARRFPNLHIVIAPVKVQGAGAAREIADAIDLLNRRGGIDVMIVGRGGGSMEDLWCFNEEIVARAIARSAIPVISAVGHEIDFTISDFVADVRAPTPSAAAELVVNRKDELENALRQLSRRLAMNLRGSMLEARSRLAAAAGSYVFREPDRLVQQYRQRIDGEQLRMKHAMVSALREVQQRLDDAGAAVARRMEDALRTSADRLERSRVQLRALNPLAVLERGYSVTRNAKGAVLRQAGEVRPGERVVTRLAHGEIESEVTEARDGQA